MARSIVDAPIIQTADRDGIEVILRLDSSWYPTGA
jgi:hypothetical protein